MQDERAVTGETVTAILGRPGAMPRPDDMRCAAKVGTGRCSKNKIFVTDQNYWSKYCSDHTKKDNKARSTGQPRVERA